jgi:hypothetical protein
MKIKNMALALGTSAVIAVAAVVFATTFKPGAEHGPKAHSCGHCSAAKTPANDATAGEVSKDYPLNVCVVSGEALGSMGEPYTLVHQEKEVRLCCRSCVKAFHENADEHLETLRAATGPSI